ncbi:hypothetical protein LPJ61_000907 [Coemansia biformis]|uniref:PHD-type domain-containing protein n=1 Tax=Coemansia biformis TaxID=1286918 RepID=A0A9W8CYL7_9FUNG|nr:hypothetical protein LPJ61_000907 [Coemansia biformis]
MAVETRQALDEYEKAVDYVRRLCEGEEVDGLPALRLEDQNKAVAGNEPGEAAGDESRFSGRRAARSALPLVLPAERPAADGLPLAQQTATSAPLGTRQQQQQQQNGTANGCKRKGDSAHDSCDACGQPGQFICCEQCPRVFHFMCVEPPMTPEAVSQIDHWFCRECSHQRSRKRKSRAHVKSIFYPLISKMEYSNPRTFAVPDEIRRLFDGVEADAEGTYVNVREDRSRRANAGPVSREFDRLVDDQGDTILCYRCGLSALHGLVVRCDYCPLSWHWDCLEPPLSSAPPSRRRWMCPNHADHAVARRHKFRKERVVDHTNAPEGTRNSGLIEVVDDDPPWHEICDPRIRYRTTSTQIRAEFSRNAAPCRIAPLPSGVASSSARPAAACAGGTAQPMPPPPMTVPEWLQAMAAFQQDVARLVAGDKAPARPSTRCACKEAARTDDKISVLTSVATRILSPAARAADDSPGVQPPARNGVHATGPQSRGQRRLRQVPLLAEHGLTRSDLEAAMDRIAASQECRSPVLRAAASPAPTACGHRPPKRRSETPPPRPLDPAAGPAPKRARTSSVAGGRAPSVAETCGTAPRAASLLARLLRAKGASALVDFLLAD